MRPTLVLLLLLAACDGKAKRPPRPELVETVRDLADRACACGTDKDCLHEVRDEWDPQKHDLQAHGLTGDEAAAFDAEVDRMRGCGDGGGVTFWLK